MEPNVNSLAEKRWAQNSLDGSSLGCRYCDVEFCVGYGRDN
jgi:hypothetical protein